MRISFRRQMSWKKKTQGELSKDQQTKPQLALFLESNVFSKDETTHIVEEGCSDSDNDLVLVVKETLVELVLISFEKSSVLIDCACPSTVTGRKWMEDFFNNLNTEDKKKVENFESEKVYKFGGGEETLVGKNHISMLFCWR